MIKKILCVEDDPISNAINVRLLKRMVEGLEVIQATNGKQAIDLIETAQSLQQPPPDLILLDLNMPIMNGWEFIEYYQNNLLSYHWPTRIVIVTSSVDKADIERAAKYSFIINYFTKPLTIENMALLLKQWL